MNGKQLGCFVALLTGALIFFSTGCSSITPKPPRKPTVKEKPKYTIGDRLRQYGKNARERWGLYFARVGASYPPKAVTLVGLKEEKMLEVYAWDHQWLLVRTIPICAASGRAGPKLQEGDMQVPEGIYDVPYLNPNSRFHLSLNVGYPNKFDREMAHRTSRNGDLGGDIMIHGDCLSRGCIAIGDDLMEDIFVLVADTGIKDTTVVIAPFDLRTRPVNSSTLEGLPEWTPKLYADIRRELNSLGEGEILR